MNYIGLSCPMPKSDNDDKSEVENDAEQEPREGKYGLDGIDQENTDTINGDTITENFRLSSHKCGPSHTIIEIFAM